MILSKWNKVGIFVGIELEIKGRGADRASAWEGHTTKKGTFSRNLILKGLFFEEF